ncbi:MAG: hypothetical protein GY872_04160 [Roseibacillus sp.]|nr:hypothetical protein [Roseibacillus sp.]
MRYLPIVLSGPLALALLASQALRGEKENGTPSFGWKETKESLALMNRDKTVWRLVFDPKLNKSYFHPLSLIDGTVLTELRPADHVWHYAGWFSWKFINGLNYWEENRRSGLPGGVSEVTDVRIHPGDDFSARIEMTLSYHPPEKAELLAEKRTLMVSAPDETGSYHIDWRSEFVAKGRKVVLERTPLPGQPGGAGHGGYAGLSIRAARVHVPWNFLDSEGRVNTHGKPARWMNHSGVVADGKEAGLTMFDHPTNAGHPSRWYTVKGMPYFSPAVIFSNPRTLDPGEKLNLRYRILVQARKGVAAELDQHYARFVGGDHGAATDAKGGKHAHAVMPMDPLKKRPIPPGFEKPDHVIQIGVRKAQMRYQVEQFAVVPGSRVKLVLANTDDMLHNLIVCKPGSGVTLSVAQKAWMMGAAAMKNHFVPEDDRVLFASRIVGVGESDEIYFVAPSQEGDYPYVCTLPGHAFTMKGVMTVSKTPGKMPPKPRVPPPVVAKHDVVVRDLPLVYRVILDGASPRTISVGLPGGHNYVFNPVTGEVEFVWLGGFINLRGERTGRGNGKNSIRGMRYETGSVPFPLRIGSIGGEPESLVFGGYSRKRRENPVFLYEVDGVQVEQELVFAKEGREIEYRFRTSGAKKPVYFLVEKKEVTAVRVSAGSYDSGVLTLQPDEARSFSVFVELNQSFPPNQGRNHALGATASSPDGLERDGAAVGDHGAIDGDPFTYWDEANGGKLYHLKVDLAQPVKVSSVSIVGYEHHDYAPRDFEVVVDGRVVKSVVNAVYRNNYLLVEFDATSGRTVELKITKYYGGSPAIRELGIYGPPAKSKP